MRKTLMLAAIVGLLAATLPAFAQSQMADGQVTKVDESTGKITIKHASLHGHGMDEPMTMVYRVQDPAVLKAVKAGDKVKFDVETVNGQSIVKSIEKAK